MTEPGTSNVAQGKEVKSSSAAEKVEYPGRLISAASIASPFQKDVSETIAKRKSQGRRVPRLIGILATPSPPSVAYAEWTKKACEQVGIEFEIWSTWQDVSVQESERQERGTAMEGVEEAKPDTDLEADVEDLIIAANADDDIHGIMVYYPIFGGRQDTYLQQILDPRKDVEGLHFSYCWNMYHNVRWVSPSQVGGAPGTTTEASLGPIDKEDHIPPGFAKSILPCTPLAVVKCLEGMGVYEGSLPYGDRLFGKVITVVNRSEVVGRPLAALLSNDGAKVYSIDLGSIQEFNKRATIEKDRKPSEAVTKARERNNARRLRTSHVVRPCNMTMQQCIEASDVVISGVPSANFKIETDWIKEGAVTVNFSSEKNFEKDVRRKASKHLPAIGKTTIAMLQRNLLRLIQYREMSGAPSSHGGGGPGPSHYGGGGGGGGDPYSSGDKGGPSRDNGPSSSRSGPGQAGGGGSSSSNTSGPTPRQTGQQDESLPLVYDRMKLATANDNRFLSQSPPVRMNYNGHSSNSIPGFASRGRASTMSLPQPDRFRDRLPSISQLSPVYSQPPKTASTASVSTTSSLWDWRQGSSRRDSVTTNPSVDFTPPFEPSQHHQKHVSANQQSPLLFAPVSPSNPPHQLPAMQMGYPTRPIPQRSTSTYTASSPRSGTPVSPLFIDGLSVEDNGYALSGVPSTRASWDYGPPRTPREGQIPSVLDRPTKDMPQRFIRGGQLSPNDEKMTFISQPNHQAITIAPPPGFDNKDAGSQVMRGTLLQAPPDRIAHSRRRRRPPFSYSSLIAQAISSSPENRMTLREIYTWISNAYPELYSMEGSEGSGWQNTVRHNLSLNKSFVKVARTAQDIYESCSSGLPNLSQAARGKGGWWTLDHNVAQAQLGPNFRGDNNDDDQSFTGDFEDGQQQAPAQRRRTSSFATSVMSNDEPLSSPMDQFAPSVLQVSNAPVQYHQQQQQRGRPQEAIVGVKDEYMPSVLMKPRTRSAERAMAQRDERHMIEEEYRVRARGYTMGDAGASFRHQIHPNLPSAPSRIISSTTLGSSSNPSAYPYSPSSKRKLRFDGSGHYPDDPKGRFIPYEEPQHQYSPYSATTSYGNGPSVAGRNSQHHLHLPQQYTQQHPSALPPPPPSHLHPLQQSHTSTKDTNNNATKTSSARLSAVRDGGGESIQERNRKEGGRMSITDLLNT